MTSLSVFQLVDRRHQGPVIKVGGPCDVIGGPPPDAIFTDAIVSRSVREGPPAQGADRGLDLREVLETDLAKGQILPAEESHLVLQKRLANETPRRVDEIDQAGERLHSSDAFTKSSKAASGLIFMDLPGLYYLTVTV